MTSRPSATPRCAGPVVVLARPQGPRNVGGVLRAVTNFGPAEIRIAGPVRPSLLIHPDFEQMAHGVEDMAARIRVTDGLAEALDDTTYALGFTARSRQHRPTLDWREARGDLMRFCGDPAERVALVFGNEETGLSGAETDLLRRLVHLPTTAEHTSINLATTVGIVLSTLFFERAPSGGSASRAPLEGDAREYLRRHVREVLGDAALSAPIREDVRASVDRVFTTAELETRDGRAWHAVMRALGNRKAPSDYGLDPSPQARDRRGRALERNRRRRGGGAAPPA